jgi:hypothetical protein
MGEFAQTFVDNPLAAAFGMMGLLCQMIWPIFRVRKAIMSVQFGIGADYGVQYALLDAWSGAGVCCIGATQTLVAFFAGERPWLRFVGIGFLPVAGAVSYFTWSGIASFFALVAVTLIMIGRLQKDTVKLRMFLLAAAPFGMSYDIAVGALPALMGGMISAVIAAAMLVREIKARTEQN